MKMKISIYLISVFGMCLLIMNSNKIVLATELKNSSNTDVGIGFTTEKEKSSSTKENIAKDNLPESGNGYPGKPTFLPNTGMLSEPIIFLLLGWFTILFVFVSYFISKQALSSEEVN